MERTVRGPAHTRGGHGTTDPRRRRPALSRSRLRVPFFVALAVLCFATGQPPAAAAAAAGVLAALVALHVARARGEDYGLSFVAVDWLTLGLTLSLAGGVSSWLVAAIPVLVFCHLAASPRTTWPYLLAPTLLLIVVLAIAEPALGGHRLLRTAELLTLVGGGAAGASRLRRPPRRRHAASVDETSGFYSSRRLPELLRACLADAEADHEPLSVVYLRLEHFRDCRDFMGAGSEALVAAVARRLHRQLRGDDLAFRVADDVFVVALRERPLAEARAIAAGLAREVGAHPIAGHRLTLAWGAAAYPAVRDPGALLDEAREAALRRPQELALAVAQ